MTAIGIKAVVVSIVAWLVLSIAISGPLSSFGVPAKFEALAERGQQVYGRVVSVDVENPQRIEYQFSVSGTTYSGLGRSAYPNPIFKELTIGSNVVITYDPTDPSNSFLGSADDEVELQERFLTGASFALTFFPVLMFFLIYIGVSLARQRSRDSERG